jgi:hypothetical protein
MKKNIFIACAIGAFIGSIISMSLNSYWWLGVIIGGLIGYLAYNPKETLCGIKTAWKRIDIKKNSKLTGIDFLRMTILLIVVSILLGAIFTNFIGLHIIRDLFQNNELSLLPENCHFRTSPEEIISAKYGIVNQIIALGMIIIIVISALCTAICVFIFLLNLFNGDKIGNLSSEDLKDTIKSILKMALLTNIIAVCFYWLPRGLLFVIKNTPLFIKTLFITIHSDIRLLCGIDSALGALAGYYLQNALIGALIGGAWGLINYWVVSVKILRLNTEKS